MSSVRGVAVLLALLTLAACADPPSTGSRPSSPAPSPRVELPAGPDALVLRVQHVGGFTTPDMLAARLPVVSVYADGRVITDGPVPAIYPGPALPNLQVTRLDPAEVRTLAEQALEAGIRETADLGTPPVADATTTRFTLVTADGRYVREAYALRESLPRDLGPAPDAGLTEEQAAARAELAAFLDELTVPSTGTAPVEPYRPDALAVVVSPWIDPGDGLEHPAQPWPGPPLPGEPLGALPEQTCLTVGGDQLAPVLDAARQATSATPWLGADGARWSLTFRPLLPDESGCADLVG
ncbi:hypothetical protein [Blastococcus goldschmidtiae]|uniref:Lipoprotein n=1 Tax=Blastococcus goldschmidtiae TaxID=3075546 RepID=A0ABU2KC31_9ACTN|nr:hypothetical protein [Blastococcus sp. DSM 46792]MDT0277745.1 hypothetical protein [Blastococcus sp. DSM 46792]